MNLWDFRFSQWCCWRCKSPGMWCYHCMIISWHLKGTMILQDVGDYVLNDTASHCRRLTTSYTNFLWVQPSAGFRLQHILDDQHCDNCSDPDSRVLCSVPEYRWLTLESGLCRYRVKAHDNLQYCTEYNFNILVVIDEYYNGINSKKVSTGAD
jgi:hypothetical protein